MAIDPLPPLEPAQPHSRLTGYQWLRVYAPSGKCSSFAGVHVSAVAGRLDATLRTFGRSSAPNVGCQAQQTGTLDPLLPVAFA